MTGSIAARLDDLESLVRWHPGRADPLAQGLQAEAEDAGETALALRALLVRADALARRGRTAECVRAMRDVNAWATDHDDRYLRARSHRLMSALFRRLGDSVLALEHAVPAVDLLDELDRPDVRADHVLGLADALAVCGSFDDARTRYRDACRLAEASGDVRLRLIVLNNMTYSEYESGDSEAAVAAAEHLLAVSAAHDIELDSALRDTIARALMMVGRYDAARRTLDPAVLDARLGAHADFDGQAHCLLTLAEIHRHQGAAARAQDTLDACLLICDEHGLDGVGVQAQREQAEIYAAQGRFAEAYAVFRDYHDRVSEVHSAERDARARTRQAIYEADEARRDSKRFRELAVRDALTGLHNRRFVDEKLPALLLNAREMGMGLTVALVDIDHFKAVNDVYSHDVGDVVLRRVATSLQQGVEGVRASITARMGGEEFLVVLPGLDGGEAMARLQDLRSLVAEQCWQDVTPGRPVTVSIGAVSVPEDGEDMSQILRRADRNLYVAKRAGRDRVVFGPQHADVPVNCSQDAEPVPPV